MNDYRLINEGFDKKYSMYESILPEQEATLESILMEEVKKLQDKGEDSVKVFESTLKEALEGQFPEKSWNEITNCDIFYDLFEDRDPMSTVTHIMEQLNEELLPEDYIAASETEEIHESVGKIMKNKPLTEARMSDEDARENALLRSIYDKTSKRANSRLTPDEQGVMDKYNLSRSKSDRGSATITSPNSVNYGDVMGYDEYDKTRVYDSKGYYKGSKYRNGDPEKKNYVDMIRKHPERKENQLTNRSWGKENHPKYQTNEYGSRIPDYSSENTFQNKERARENDRMKDDYNQMKRSLYDRKYHGNHFANAEANRDRELEKAKKDYDSAVERANHSYDFDKKYHGGLLDSANDNIDRLLKRGKYIPKKTIETPSYSYDMDDAEFDEYYESLQRMNEGENDQIADDVWTDKSFDKYIDHAVANDAFTTKSWDKYIKEGVNDQRHSDSFDEQSWDEYTKRAGCADDVWDPSLSWGQYIDESFLNESNKEEKEYEKKTGKKMGDEKKRVRRYFNRSVSYTDPHMNGADTGEHGTKRDFAKSTNKTMDDERTNNRNIKLAKKHSQNAKDIAKKETEKADSYKDKVDSYSNSKKKGDYERAKKESLMNEDEHSRRIAQAIRGGKPTRSYKQYDSNIEEYEDGPMMVQFQDNGRNELRQRGRRSDRWESPRTSTSTFARAWDSRKGDASVGNVYNNAYGDDEIETSKYGSRAKISKFLDTYDESVEKEVKEECSTGMNSVGTQASDIAKIPNATPNKKDDKDIPAVKEGCGKKKKDKELDEAKDLVNKNKSIAHALNMHKDELMGIMDIKELAKKAVEIVNSSDMAGTDAAKRFQKDVTGRPNKVASTIATYMTGEKVIK